MQMAKCSFKACTNEFPDTIHSLRCFWSFHLSLSEVWERKASGTGCCRAMWKNRYSSIISQTQCEHLMGVRCAAMPIAHMWDCIRNEKLPVPVSRHRLHAQSIWCKRDDFSLALVKQFMIICLTTMCHEMNVRCVWLHSWIMTCILCRNLYNVYSCYLLKINRIISMV